MHKRVRIGVQAALAVIALSGSSGAFANYGGASLTIKAPSSVRYESTYTVTISGTTGHGSDNALITFEGGGRKALPCYSSWASERRYYPGNEIEQLPVHGAFTKSISFRAAHMGPKAFCAYLFNSADKSGFLNDYAFAQAAWTVA